MFYSRISMVSIVPELVAERVECLISNTNDSMYHRDKGSCAWRMQSVLSQGTDVRYKTQNQPFSTSPSVLGSTHPSPPLPGRSLRFLPQTTPSQDRHHTVSIIRQSNTSRSAEKPCGLLSKLVRSQAQTLAEIARRCTLTSTSTSHIAHRGSPCASTKY